MDESRLRDMRADIEDNLELPDFDAVDVRARQIRRRRTAVTGALAVLAVAATTFVLVQSTDSTRSQPPTVDRPSVPSIDSRAALQVLANPDAQVDPDHSEVDGAGHMLAVVVVGDHSFGRTFTPGCPTSSDHTVVRWSGPHGTMHAWVDRPRPVRALAHGFALGAVPRPCWSGSPVDKTAYLVDATGRPRPVAWASGAESVCEEHPRDAGCIFDVRARSASLADIRVPSGSRLLHSPREFMGVGPWWASAAGSRRISWSVDGRRWQHRSSTAPPGAIVSVAAAGRWAVLAGNTSVDYTSDGGTTWRHRDLSSALASLRIGDVDWTVTSTGRLLGVTQLVGRGDVLFRSTDASWTRFVAAPVHTGFGLVRPSVEGRAVYVVDQERWAISLDDGASWRRTPPLP